MENQKNNSLELTSKEIVKLILEDFKKIDIGRYDYYYIPYKSDFTKAMSLSIRETCKRLKLRVVQEVDIKMPEHIRIEHKRKNGGIVDFIIINPNGKDIAIELDSYHKNYSYKKLEVLDERGHDSFWLVWSRNHNGKAKDPHNNKELGFINENVNIVRHTFHADLSNKP